MTEYPNREHRNLHNSAKRRAISALLELEEQAKALRNRLMIQETPEADSSDAVRFEELSGKLREYLAIIETLRSVREWHQADELDRIKATVTARLTVGHTHPGTTWHPGWKGHDGYAVHRHDSTGQAEWELYRGDGTPVTTMKEQEKRTI